MSEDTELSVLPSRDIPDDTDDTSTKLLSLLHEKNLVEFDRILKTASFDIDYFYNDYQGTLLHIACRSKGNHEIVKILLDHGANINLINKAHESAPIHETIENADIQTLNVLLSNEKCNLSLRLGSKRKLTPAMKAAYLFRADMLCKLLETNATAACNGFTQRKNSIHESESNTAQQLSSRTVNSEDQDSILLSLFHGLLDTKDISKKSDFRECLDLILNKIPPSQLNVNARDEDGNTALHYAVKLNDEPTVLRLLNAGSYVCNKNIDGEVILRSIKRKTLERYLDSCVSTNEQLPIQPDYEFILDCQIFKPPENYPRRPEIEPLLQLNKVPELRSLLEHPILHNFLDIKWHLTKKWYYINVAFYLLFCLALGSYVFIISCAGHRQHPCSSTSSSNNSSNNCSNTTSDQFNPMLINSSTDHISKKISNNRNPTSTPNIPIFNILRSLTSVLCVTLVTREILQIYVSIRKYFKSPENYLEILIIIATIILLVGDVNLELGAVAILASGFELVLLIGRHPRLSTNTEIFKTVTINFLKFLRWYWILVFAFAISLNISRRSGKVTTEDDQSPLHQLANSLFEMISMMIQPQTGHKAIEFNLKHLIFMLNVFFISIVLLSLLNGLAVHDVEKIRKRARLNGIVSRMNFILYIDVWPYICFNLIIRRAKNLAKFCCRCCCKLQCCQNSNDEPPDGDKCIKIFPIQSRLFPEALPDGKFRVLPNKNMSVFLAENSTLSLKMLSDWSMDEDIVKGVEKILEKRELLDCDEFLKEHDALQSSEIENKLKKYVWEVITESKKSQKQRTRFPGEKIQDSDGDSQSELEPGSEGEETDSDLVLESEPESPPQSEKNFENSKIDTVKDSPKTEMELAIDEPTSSNIALPKETVLIKLLSLLKDYNSIEFAKILETDSSYANYFYGDPYNGTLLHIACSSKGNHEIVRILLDHGADINSINKAGSAPIHEAIENSDIETLDVLLSNKKCDLNLRDRFGRTPAMKSAFLIHADMLSRLLKNMSIADLPVDYKALYDSVFKGMKDKQFVKCLDLIRNAKLLSAKDAGLHSEEGTAAMKLLAEPQRRILDAAVSQITK